MADPAPLTAETLALDQSTARGAKRIFLRFIIVAVGLNALVGLAVVIYDVADSIWVTRDHMRSTGDLVAQVALHLRRDLRQSDVDVVKHAAEVTGVPLALLDRRGVIRYSSHRALPGHLKTIYPRGVLPGMRFDVRSSLGELSGGWMVTPFSNTHDLLIVVRRGPEEEGMVEYMTIAAGLTGLGLALSFVIMLVAANWMLRRPLSRLVSQLTSALAEDVQRRRLAEERAVAARLEAEEHLAFRDNLIDASEAVGIVATDAAGRLQILNRAAERILGFRAADVVGRLTLDEIAQRGAGHTFPLVHPAEGEEFWTDAQGAEHLLDIRRSEIRDTDGSRRGTLVTFIDVTERRRLESELALNELKLIQSAKMATLGEMATGIAHEVNQPLNNIGLLASRLTRRLSTVTLAEEERLFCRDKLSKVQEQVERASKIIIHLRAFGRVTTKKLAAVQLHVPVDGVLVFLREQLREHGIELEIDLPADLPPVLADEAQLEQVLMNLLLNARDALCVADPAPSEKRIRIVGRPTTLGRALAVCVSVSDSGAGMSDEVRGRIFEPFFTTKDVGQGTGLGLSISYGLVRDFGGTLEVESQPGQGATFSIVLRAAS